jgi:hypothetical protein
MLEILKSIIAIIICGGIGGLVAWWLVMAMGLGGTLGAVLAAVIAMVVAVAVFAGLTVLMRALGVMK